jgi:hypothetical protein
MTEADKELVEASNLVIDIDIDELQKLFEATVDPKGAWRANDPEPLAMMCRALASVAVLYFRDQVRAGEKMQ